MPPYDTSRGTPETAEIPQRLRQLFGHLNICMNKQDMVIFKEAFETAFRTYTVGYMEEMWEQYQREACSTIPQNPTPFSPALPGEAPNEYPMYSQPSALLFGFDPSHSTRQQKTNANPQMQHQPTIYSDYTPPYTLPTVQPDRYPTDNGMAQARRQTQIAAMRTNMAVSSMTAFLRPVSSNVTNVSQPRNQTGRLKVPCPDPLCISSFARLQGLKPHLELHKKKAAFRCQHLEHENESESFAYSHEELLHHHETCHNGCTQEPTSCFNKSEEYTQKSYSCGICGAVSLISLYEFANHWWTHIKEYGYSKTDIDKNNIIRSLLRQPTLQSYWTERHERGLGGYEILPNTTWNQNSFDIEYLEFALAFGIADGRSFDESGVASQVADDALGLSLQAHRPLGPPSFRVTRKQETMPILESPYTSPEPY